MIWKCLRSGILKLEIKEGERLPDTNLRRKKWSMHKPFSTFKAYTGLIRVALQAGSRASVIAYYLPNENDNPTDVFTHDMGCLVTSRPAIFSRFSFSIFTPSELK